MEEVVSAENYGKALKAVIANKGAPGIDGMTTEELNGHLLKHFPKIHSKLMAGTYVPTPVRRKEIDKQGGGQRKLGISQRYEPVRTARTLVELFKNSNRRIHSFMTSLPSIFAGTNFQRRAACIARLAK